MAVIVGTALSFVPFGPGGGRPAGAQEAVDYDPPVDAPVIDPFRPPPRPWLPGNRGIEYATVPGTPVRAAARGAVTFAGSVAGSLHVTVLHPDGVRTSYSFLATVAVRAGANVARGQVVGTTGSRFHVGARRGDTYLDPASLWGRGPPWARLVPLDGSRGRPRTGRSARLVGPGLLAPRIDPRPRHLAAARSHLTARSSHGRLPAFGTG